MTGLQKREEEAIGARLLREYESLFDGTRCPWRVDIRLLAEQVLHLKIRHAHLSPDRKIWGLTSTEPLTLELFDGENWQKISLDGATVCLEKDLLSEGALSARYRFTLAHEAAHHLTAKGTHGTDEGRANRLAAQLLMPKEYIGRALFCQGLSCPVSYANPYVLPDLFSRLSGAASMLGVSVRALLIRLTDLGWLLRDESVCPQMFWRTG